jgi:hypothetical protein
MTELGQGLLKAMRQAVEGEKVKYQRVNAEISFVDSEGKKHIVTSNLQGKPKQCWIANLDKWPDSETFLYNPQEIGHPQATHFVEASALDQSQRELEACEQMLDVARKALEKAKVEYWNKCYAGSGTIKAMTLSEFDRMIDEALAKIGDGK